MQQTELVQIAIEAAGGTGTALAEVLGAHHSDVSRWRRGIKPVPYKHRIAIEELTGGAVKAVDFEPKPFVTVA